jgi:hypothetical protein
MTNGARRIWPIRAAMLAAVVAMTVAVSATPAGAHPATGDWSGNHTICNGCTVSRGHIVAMWQLMLMSSVSGLGSCDSFVDGVFGSRTAAATRTWQRDHLLTDDGIVGRNTWRKAQSYLVYTHTTANNFDVYYYLGGAGPAVDLARHRDTGVWYFLGNFDGSNQYCANEEEGILADH